MTMWTPSRASALAHANPSPLLDAQTIARFPCNPRSIVPIPYVMYFRVCRGGRNVASARSSQAIPPPRRVGDGPAQEPGRVRPFETAAAPARIAYLKLHEVGCTRSSLLA